VTVLFTLPNCIYVPARRLRFVVQPDGAVSGVALSQQPQVEVLDENGSRVSTSGDVITLTGTAGASGGPFTATTVSGLATFAAVTLAGSGNSTGHWVGRATSPGVRSCLSGEVILFTADTVGSNGGKVPTVFEESDYVDNASRPGIPATTPDARATWTTSATTADVYWRFDKPGFSSQNTLTVLVDGVFNQNILASADADGDYLNTISLPGGSKRVTIVNGFVTGSATGAILTGVLFGSAATRVAPATPPARVQMFGDSIGVVVTDGDPTQKCWPVLMRDTIGISVVNSCVSGKSFFDYAPNPPAAIAVADGFIGRAPTTFVFGLLANDLIGHPWTGAQYGAALEAFMDETHLLFPDCLFICCTTLGPNDYNDAMIAACATRSWSLFHDASAYLTGGDYGDGLHLNSSGTAKVAAHVGALVV
jgi:hypothetical protein